MPRPPKTPEISPQDLARTIENGEAIQILDVRAPARVATGRIDTAPADQFHNIVGSRLMMMQSAGQIGLDVAMPVAVVCGHGNSSKAAATFLNQIGYQARSMRGGMAAWMLMTVRRDLWAPRPLDLLIQFDRVGKGALGYLLVSDGAALIIDPPRDAGPYIAALHEAGASLVAVADTHCHADYISGGPGLAEAHGVPYYLHPADAVYPYDGTQGRVAFDAVHDGTVIQVGRARVRVQHTPGHTDGSVTYLLDDEAAFTGDFLFVASVGRPDLAGKTREWTKELWQSIQKAKDTWTQNLAIYPAHYGAAAERRDDRSVGARFGDLLENNEALAKATAEDFARWVESKVAPFPENYHRIKAINVGLELVNELEAEELEVGRNECAVG